MTAASDVRCPVWWGNVQCLDDDGHIAVDGGGHHMFDLRHLGVRREVLVDGDARGLRTREAVTADA